MTVRGPATPLHVLPTLLALALAAPASARPDDPTSEGDAGRAARTIAIIEDARWGVARRCNACEALAALRAASGSRAGDRAAVAAMTGFLNELLGQTTELGGMRALKPGVADALTRVATVLGDAFGADAEAAAPVLARAFEELRATADAPRLEEEADDLEFIREELGRPARRANPALDALPPPIPFGLKAPTDRFDLRVKLLRVLGRVGPDRATPRLLTAVRDRREPLAIRVAAAEVLARARGAGASAGLAAFLTDPAEGPDEVRTAAAKALGLGGRAADLPALEAIEAAEPDGPLRRAAGRAIAAIRDRDRRGRADEPGPAARD